MKSRPVRLGRALALSILFFTTIFSLLGVPLHLQNQKPSKSKKQAAAGSGS